MSENAQLTINGQTYELPVVKGTENEIGIDISKLRAQSKVITLDPGFGNTGACRSAITYLDGEKGILRYRGIPIEQIAEKSTFVETSYLLINGQLPTTDQLSDFSQVFTENAGIHDEMKKMLDGYPQDGHPMGIVSAMVCSLSGYYPQLINPEPSEEEVQRCAAQLLAKIRTIVAYVYKRMKGDAYIAPRDDLQYIPNFLHMMFSKPGKDYEIMPEVVNALKVLLILHADHEQNCSTSTVRMVGSSWANMFASISAGVCALWGPLHGGANQAVLEMLEQIQAEGGNIQKFIDKAKDSDDKFRLMGFGHRVYKNFDPRATIIKKRADDLLVKLGINDPLLDLAKTLEDAVLKDDYFKERKLYPNVDFYSGIIYKAIGIPTPMFPVMFSIGRLPGWIAHWKEMKESSETKIGRPRQIYTGETERSYISIDQR